MKTKSLSSPVWDERLTSALPPKLTAQAIHLIASLRDERAVLIAFRLSSADSEVFFLHISMSCFQLPRLSVNECYAILASSLSNHHNIIS